MVEITPILTTTLIGMMGVVLGAIVSNYINSKVAMNNSRRDIIFKKKLEYFERIIEAIEANTKLYKYSLRTVEKKTNKKTIENAIKKLKKERKHFEAKTSPLYLDTRLFAESIKSFVAIEKIIFVCFESLIKTEEGKEKQIEDLRKNIKNLISTGNSLILQMRQNLEKE